MLFEVCDVPKGHSCVSLGIAAPCTGKSLREIADPTKQGFAPADFRLRTQAATVHTALMSVKSAALLALIGMILLTLCLLANLINVVVSPQDAP